MFWRGFCLCFSSRPEKDDFEKLTLCFEEILQNAQQLSLRVASRLQQGKKENEFAEFRCRLDQVLEEQSEILEFEWDCLLEELKRAVRCEQKRKEMLDELLPLYLQLLGALTVLMDNLKVDDSEAHKESFWRQLAENISDVLMKEKSWAQQRQELTF